MFSLVYSFNGISTPYGLFNARGVMVIIAGIGHGDTSSNPGLIAFHIALIQTRFFGLGEATSLGEGKL